MALTGSWTKTVQTTENKSTSLQAAVVESSGAFVVNVVNTITKDDDSTVTKLVARIKLTPVYTGDSVEFTITSLTFPGTADDATSSSAILPPDSQANPSTPKAQGKTNSINLTNFYIAAGDVL